MPCLEVRQGTTRVRQANNIKTTRLPNRRFENNTLTMQPVQLITMIMIMLKMTMLTMTIVMMMFMLRVVGGDDDRGARSGGDQNDDAYVL